MIRINLLPQTKKAARTRAPVATGSSAPWLVAYLIITLAWVAALLAAYLIKASDLDEIQARNRQVEETATRLEQQSAGLDEVQLKLAESHDLEGLVDELNRARIGPTRVLVELSKVLSVNGGPTIDPRELERMQRDNPHVRINRTWDPKRLWITSFTEEDRVCRIEGLGRTNDDIAEFLRRLAISEVFERVTLERTRSVENQGSAIQFIAFELSCRVEY
jgi:type IV pilus assembly protein PilN